MTFRMLVLRYSFFAIIATMANLASQRLVLAIDSSGRGYLFAVGSGTIVGLVIKYILDKRWIFYDQGTGYKAHSQKFGLYTGAGVVTTIIFWGTETLFWVLFGTTAMRELGAVVGLAIGYIVKYNLDRRYVFTEDQFERGDIR